MRWSEYADAFMDYFCLSRLRRPMVRRPSRLGRDRMPCRTHGGDSVGNRNRNVNSGIPVPKISQLKILIFI